MIDIAGDKHVVGALDVPSQRVAAEAVARNDIRLAREQFQRNIRSLKIAPPIERRDAGDRLREPLGEVSLGQ